MISRKFLANACIVIKDLRASSRLVGDKSVDVQTNDDDGVCLDYLILARLHIDSFDIAQSNFRLLSS